jgi:hypothetical protein
LKWARARYWLMSFSVAIIFSISGITRGAEGRPSGGKRFSFQHVLLISIDGFHALDLAECIHSETCPTLAELARHGVTYTNASTSRPSDSFPGFTAQITGGLPPTTGIWYDVTYDRDLYPPGSNCRGPRGAIAPFNKAIDYDHTRLDGGASLHGGKAIDPAKLPLDPRAGCRPVYPHSYLRVNTIFEVAKAAGLRTAWSDKHPSYDLANGPSGAGVDDLYTPEVDSLVPGGTCNGDGSSITWADSICGVEANDRLKVTAVLHEIDGFDHTGAKHTGVPALFGTNFQSVDVAQKIRDDYRFGQGGYSYVKGVITPSRGLENAIQSVDTSLGRLVSELRKNGLLDDTLVIVSAKHGQSPLDASKHRDINLHGDSTPSSVFGQAIGSNYAFDVADDGALIWVKDPSRTGAAVAALSEPGTEDRLGIQEILSGELLKLIFDDPLTDPRTPDIILKTNTGVVYTHGNKLAEHGGLNQDDLHVALLVSSPRLASALVHEAVETRQIAPSILRALGLRPRDLAAVHIEKTRVLPDLFSESGTRSR